RLAQATLEGSAQSASVVTPVQGLGTAPQNAIRTLAVTYALPAGPAAPCSVRSVRGPFAPAPWLSSESATSTGRPPSQSILPVLPAASIRTHSMLPAGAL